MPRIVRTLALSATATALVLASATAPAAAAPSVGLGAAEDTVQTCIAHAVVGSWKGTVDHQGGSGTISLTFNSNGTMRLKSGGDAGGGGGEGPGTWKAGTGTTFTFSARERLFDGSGATTGWVDVNQKGSVYGNKLQSSGISKIYDANGKYITSANASISATRS